MTEGFALSSCTENEALFFFFGGENNSRDTINQDIDGRNEFSGGIFSRCLAVIYYATINNDPELRSVGIAPYRIRSIHP
jgi:hypothetical protein